jgi:hypothetical protein
MHDAGHQNPRKELTAHTEPASFFCVHCANHYGKVQQRRKGFENADFE